MLFQQKNGETINLDFKDMRYDIDRKADAERLEYELKIIQLLYNLLNKR